MDGLNHYAYCEGNPIKYTDPTGLLNEDDYDGTYAGTFGGDDQRSYGSLPSNTPIGGSSNGGGGNTLKDKRKANKANIRRAINEGKHPLHYIVSEFNKKWQTNANEWCKDHGFKEPFNPSKWDSGKPSFGIGEAVEANLRDKCIYGIEANQPDDYAGLLASAGVSDVSGGNQAFRDAWEKARGGVNKIGQWAKNWWSCFKDDTIAETILFLDILPWTSIGTFIGGLIGSSYGPEGTVIGAKAGALSSIVFSVGLDLHAALIGWEKRNNNGRYLASYTIGIIGSIVTYIPMLGDSIGVPLEMFGYIGTKDDVFY